MINEFFDALGQRIAALFGPILDYLYLLEWWGLLAAFVVLCLLIGYFLNFTWARATLGFLILLAGAFVAGGTTMWKHMRKEQPKPPPEPQKRDDWKW